MADDAGAAGAESPVYLDSNKPEAERCVEMAADAWKAGDLAKAQRMLTKSLKLYPTRQAQQLIQQLAAEVDKAQQREKQRSEHLRRAAEQQNQERQQQQQQQQHHHRPQHQQQHQQQQHTPQRAAAAAAPATPSKSAASPAHPAGAAYTVEQSQSARLIIERKKDYYAIFSVTRTATETEIKSSYRKLALRFHPDKNKAPEAEEAFKVVGSAYSVLSDPNKRAHYDAYGEDDNSGGGGQRASRQQQYQREEDLSPNDIFEMFFNGGMGGGNGGRGGQRTYTYRRQAAPRQQQQHQHDESPAALFSQFAHFLPLLLLLLFGILSAPSGEEQLFGLDKSASFPVARVTHQAQVNYFVNHQFDYRFRRDKRALEQVEAMVEAQAFKVAEEQCQKQKRDLSAEERRVKKDYKGKELASRLQGLHAKQLEACERLRTYQTNAHGSKGG